MGTFQPEFKEVVLPSGKFARVRSMTGADYLLAKETEKVGWDISYSLICISTMIDDKQLQYKDLLDMDLRDVMTIQEVVLSFMKGPVQNSEKSDPPKYGTSKDS